MRVQSSRGWVMTLALAALAVLGAMAARSVAAASSVDEVEATADSCVRYGRIECCIKDPQ